MIALILSFVTGILPGLGQTLVNAYQARLTAENSAAQIAAGLVVKEMDLAQREAELSETLRQAQIGKWYEPEHLFGYALWIYFAKILVWDKVLGLGSTDPLTGHVAAWAGAIVGMYFGKRTIENVTKLIKG